MIEGLDPNVWAGLRVLPAAARIELIDTYFEYSLTVLTELRTATDAGNGAAFWLLVHQLKGCSASLGVQVPWRLCEELEQQDRAGTLMDLSAAGHRIEVAHGEGIRALAALRASLDMRT